MAALLWAAQGVTARQGPYLLRTAPSAGALYPFETYVILNRVEGMEPGLAHFDPTAFELRRLRAGNLSEELVDGCLRQRFLAWASAVVVWTAVAERCIWKYGDRATRYIGLDLGHVCGNLLTAAAALGLGGCPVGAFLDDPMNRLLEVDGEREYVFYLASAGLPRTPGALDTTNVPDD